MFGIVRLAFGTILQNLRKSSEIHQKRRHQYVNLIKRTLHVSSKIWILCSRGNNNISLVVRYCSLLSNIKFISSLHRVISSIHHTQHLIIILLNTLYDWIYENGVNRICTKSPIFHFDFTTPNGSLQAEWKEKKDRLSFWFLYRHLC